MSNDKALLRDPAALMVLRVWIERGSALPLRAYSRRTADVSRGFEESSVDTDIEAAVDTVRSWLEGLLDAGPNADAPGAVAGAPPPGDGLPTGDLSDGPATSNGAAPGP